LNTPPPIIRKHYQLLNIIKSEYSYALERGNFETVIKYCLEDIALAKELKKIFSENGEEMPFYPSFVTLVKIYQRQGLYLEAKDICKRALELGYDNDGTKGGFQNRISKIDNLSKGT
jgi:hypothetical protein